jgi:hypothetical protein
MARRPKKISPHQITGQQGVNHVERIVLDMGLAWHPTNANLEAGIDGVIEVVDPETGEATNNIIQVQVKTTSLKWTYDTATDFTYKCDERDIDYWMGGNTPVVLVVLRPDGSEAYWVPIQEWFNTPEKRKDRHVKFNKIDDLFDTNCRSRLIRLALPKDSGIYLPPLPQEEHLISNLLNITRFPTSIFVAQTNRRKPSEIFEWARSENIFLPSGWIMTEKSIRSFHDLRESPWDGLCERGTVEEFCSDEWADSQDADQAKQFSWLLGEALREDLHHHSVRFSRKEKCYYFSEWEGMRERKFGYKSLQQNTSRTVVNARHNKETGDLQYLRHDAFRGRFLKIEESWFLEIVPTYLFTVDGRNKYVYGDNLLSGLKKLQRQGAVLGQIVMWKALLTQEQSMFDRTPRLLGFGELLQISFEHAINDTDWLNNDPLNEGNEDSGDGWGLF